MSALGPESSPPTELHGPSPTTLICMPRLEMVLKAPRPQQSQVKWPSSAGTVLQSTHFMLPTQGQSQPCWCHAKAALSLQIPENSPSPPSFLTQAMGTAWRSCHHPVAKAGGTTTLSIITIRDHRHLSPSFVCL